MIKMNLNEREVKEVVDTMAAADFGPEVEIQELYEDSADITEADYYGAEYEGYGSYEDYEPNPYDGTYSEM